jgi:hypothetical protein
MMTLIERVRVLEEANESLEQTLKMHTSPPEVSIEPIAITSAYE